MDMSQKMGTYFLRYSAQKWKSQKITYTLIYRAIVDDMNTSAGEKFRFSGTFSYGV